MKIYSLLKQNKFNIAAKEAEEAKKSDFDYDTYNGGVEYFGKK